MSRRSARLSSSSFPSPSIPESTTSATNKKRKAAIDNDGFAIPSTPKRSRAKVATAKSLGKSPLAPETPTPAAASQMAVPYSSGDIDDSTPPPPSFVNRLANPRGTNAPLFSPMTSRLVSRDNASILENESPTKNGKAVEVKEEGKEFESTTDHILEEALKHLIKVDPRLKPVIEKHRCKVFSKEGLMEVIDPFRSLASGIISQQVSGAAAKAIKNRFVALFNQPPEEEASAEIKVEIKPDPSTPPSAQPPPEAKFPTPLQVVATSIETLRTAGLSQRKAEYIHGLAEKFVSGELTTEFLLNAEYEAVLEELVKVRGLGKWSVEMFACFGLKRMDVFSTGDLGVQRGMAALSGRDVSKLKAKGGGKWKYMSEKEMLDISSKFAPYRSVFMWYMWRVEDVDVSTLESG